MEPGSLDCSLVSLGPFAQGAFFWNENENVDEGAGVWQRLGRKCVPFAKVFGKTKIMSFLKGPWERIASYSSM